MQSLMGTWRLIRVYEVPKGTQSAALAASPVQFIRFRPDTTFSSYNAGTVELSFANLSELIDKPSRNVEQYLVQDKGMVYFYRDSVAVDTQACFIVASRLGEFNAGEMLMMPPAGQYSGRLIKVYTRPRNASGPNTPNDNKGRGRVNRYGPPPKPNEYFN